MWAMASPESKEQFLGLAISLQLTMGLPSTIAPPSTTKTSSRKQSTGAGMAAAFSTAGSQISPAGTAAWAWDAAATRPMAEQTRILRMAKPLSRRELLRERLTLPMPDYG